MHTCVSVDMRTASSFSLSLLRVLYGFLSRTPPKVSAVSKWIHERMAVAIHVAKMD